MTTDKTTTAAKKAAILAEALPYIRRFAGSLIVIKYGGNAMIDGALKNSFAEDVVLLKLVGLHPVVVHGGGPQINRLLEKVGKKSEFIQGIRVTDAETMELVEMVLGGHVNKEITSLLNQHGAKAVGITGRDAHCIKVKKLVLDEAHQAVDLGRVGEICAIDTNLVVNMIQGGHIPVIAPIGVDDQGEAFNINADTVAGSLAQALQAEKLIVMTNIEGVLDKAGQLIAKLTPAKVNALIEDGTLSDGMLPKIASALQAVTSGVKATHIIDGRVSHALLLEIFTDEGVGTMILADETDVARANNAADNLLASKTSPFPET